MEVKGKKVAVVSQGDYPEYLEKQINVYLDKVDFFVCCLRTHNREGSARRMLLENYSKYPREEFETIYFDDEAQKYTVKENVVDDIVSIIMSNQ